MKLLEPILIRQLELTNRIVMPPMATEKSKDGGVSDALCSYYADRSGDLGLIITEHAYVMGAGKASPYQLSVAEDASVEALRRIPEAIHQKGHTKVMAQINHAGAAAKEEVTGVPTRTVNELGLEDLKAIKAAFVDAALRVQSAGFDGVEIHAAHGYLLNQFYSPLTNQRADRLGGGSLDTRTAYICEVIQAVREAVGPDYPVALRFGACDYKEGGSLLEEAPEAARRFEEAGVDLLDITGGMNGFIHPTETSPGWFQALSGKIRGAVKIPVMVTGGVTDLGVAEAILVKGHADLIGVGRPLLKDAAWLRKQVACDELF